MQYIEYSLYILNYFVGEYTSGYVKRLFSLSFSRDCPIFYMRKKVQKDLDDQEKLISRFGWWRMGIFHLFAFNFLNIHSSSYLSEGVCHTPDCKESFSSGWINKIAFL